MKLTLRREGEERRWPYYLFWGRVRTSTAVLVLAFLATWWLYETYQPAPAPPPATQVVPPGFVPDPEYTWVPRTSVQTRPPTTTTTPTTTETAPTETTETTATTPPGDATTTTGPSPVSPTPLAPGETPQTTAENRSGTPTTAPVPTLPGGPGQSPTPPPTAQ